MKRQFNEFLDDIIFEIEFIKSVTKDLELKEFKKDILKIRAITKSLEIIGEAVSNVPVEIKEKYGEVEWRKIKGFRDISTHKYWSVDLDYEWYIIKRKLDLLEKQIRKIVDENI